MKMFNKKILLIVAGILFSCNCFSADKQNSGDVALAAIGVAGGSTAVTIYLPPETEYINYMRNGRVQSNSLRDRIVRFFKSPVPREIAKSGARFVPIAGEEATTGFIMEAGLVTTVNFGVVVLGGSLGYLAGAGLVTLDEEFNNGRVIGYLGDGIYYVAEGKYKEDIQNLISSLIR